MQLLLSKQKMEHQRVLSYSQCSIFETTQISPEYGRYDMSGAIGTREPCLARNALIKENAVV